VARPDRGVNDGYPTDPAIRQTDRVADIDWSVRAHQAERAITRRHLRRLAGVLPGTRLGRIRWPRRTPIAPFPWHYWWQAHLLDCLVDAQQRDPGERRGRTIAAVTRSVRLHNAGSWINRYYDDIAWFGLAVHRAGPLAGRSGASALAAITTQLGRGWTEHGGGGIWWRRGDNSKNAPANGPAAILLARTGQVEFAVAIADWMSETLVDPETGLVHEVQTADRRVRDRYAAAAARQRAEIATALRRAGAAQLRLRTDSDWLVDIVRFVAARRHALSYGAVRGGGPASREVA
jgi:predicted alpha-1,6-mannanase (GH76 family)